MIFSSCEERDGKFHRCACALGYKLAEDKRKCHREFKYVSLCIQQSWNDSLRDTLLAESRKKYSHNLAAPEPLAMRANWWVDRPEPSLAPAVGFCQSVRHPAAR